MGSETIVRVIILTIATFAIGVGMGAIIERYKWCDYLDNRSQYDTCMNTREVPK